MQELLVFRGVAAADGIRMVMDVYGRIVRMHHMLVRFRRIEMKHARFAMIDPDDGVIMFAHVMLPVQAAASAEVDALRLLTGDMGARSPER